MEEIAISEFKATCLAVLENVRKTGKAVLVTRFGEPMAEVVPPHASRKAPGIGWVRWRERVKSTATLFLRPVRKTIGKHCADEAAA